MAYDFAGALKSGVTPQQITSYLSSKGQGQLAQTYFNMNPTPVSAANSNPAAALGLLKSLATPIARLGVNAYNYTTAAKDLYENGGNPNAKATEDINQPRTLPFVGTVAPNDNSKLSGTLKTAEDAFNVGATVDGAAELPDAISKGVSVIGSAQDAIAASAASKAATVAPEESLNTAANLTRGVQDEKYQLQAAAEDSRNLAEGKPAVRTTFNNGVLDTTKIAPSAKEVEVAKSIKPLLDSGEVSPAKPYTENAAAVQKQISSEVARVRAGADALGAKLEATPEDIKGVFEKTALPNKMGADETQARLAAKFQQSIMDTAAKSKDLLEFQQQFSKQAVKDFGQDVFTNPRNPAQDYLGELRSNFNDLIQSKFPDGKLPEGDTFKAAQKNISNMIQAKEGVIENGVRGNQVGSNKITRALDKSPIGKALGRRIAMREATSSIIKGVTGAGAAALAFLGYKAAKKK